MDEHKVARGLGWFSIGLGLAELLAPRRLTKMLGLKPHGVLLRGFAARELGAGVGLLRGDRPAPWLWARVAGDAVDLGALAVSLLTSKRRGVVGVALGSVVAITALDVLCAARLSRPAAI